MNPLFLITVTPEYRGILNIDLQNFLDMVPNLVFFVLTVLLVTYLLYKPVRKILAARAERVEGDISDAALSKASAAELKAMYEKKVRDIEAERNEILDEARKLASERSAKMLDEAKTDAQDVKNRAARDVANELEQIKGMVHQSIVDISTDMAAKLIAATIDAKAHEKLFDEAMAELEATTAFNKESVTA
ncbi:MAG: F0F1 ATP synthase subunit B [Defluviitaleaceae bacterium]|nr:F0F1 ATP synthase subunit B [Defluviitaleaceae bacterium]